MSGRDIQTELQIINSFFKEKDIETIAVTPFNDKQLESKNFTIRSNTLQALKKHLGSLAYGGISNYDWISNANEALATLLTNGYSMLRIPSIRADYPIYSTKDVNIG